MAKWSERFVNATTLPGCGAAGKSYHDVLMGRLRKKIQAQYPQEVIPPFAARAICSNCADEKITAFFFPLSLRVRFLLATAAVVLCFRLPTEWLR